MSQTTAQWTERSKFFPWAAKSSNIGSVSLWTYRFIAINSMISKTNPWCREHSWWIYGHIFDESGGACIAGLVRCSAMLVIRGSTSRFSLKIILCWSSAHKMFLPNNLSKLPFFCETFSFLSYGLDLLLWLLARCSSLKGWRSVTHLFRSNIF